MQHLLISQASSPLKPIGSADNLELYKVDDFVKALEDSVNIMKPPRVIDNDYIAGRYEAYKNKAFSSNPREDDRLKDEAVKLDLANDFWRWRMDGG